MKFIISILFLSLFSTLVYANEIAVISDDVPTQKIESRQNKQVINSASILNDKQRNRAIAIELYVNSEYEDKAKKQINKLPVAIINHGYGVKNTEYAFLANDFANKGYFVVSIQQDLSSDLPLPRTGNLFERRKPYWECGVQNLLFTISELKKIKPYLNLDKVLLIGHSNGGDISMMFATYYPKQVSKIISLDSLRYPFPIKDNIPILSLRANDTKADDDVLPQSNEYIHIIPIESKHIDMYDAGPIAVKQEILNQVSKFLKAPDPELAS